MWWYHAHKVVVFCLLDHLSYLLASSVLVLDFIFSCFLLSVCVAVSVIFLLIFLSFWGVFCFLLFAFCVALRFVFAFAFVFFCNDTQSRCACVFFALLSAVRLSFILLMWVLCVIFYGCGCLSSLVSYRPWGWSSAGHHRPTFATAQFLVFFFPHVFFRFRFSFSFSFSFSVSFFFV